MGDDAEKSREPEGGPDARTRAFQQSRLTRVEIEGESLRLSTSSERLRASEERETSLSWQLAEEEGGEIADGGRTWSEKVADFRSRRQDEVEQVEDFPGLRTRGTLWKEPVKPPANNWIPIGPSAVRRGQASTRPVVSGRTAGIAVAPGGNRIYIAAANGGIWRSEDCGSSWRSLMDGFDIDRDKPVHLETDALSCGAIALAPGATAAEDCIYAGMGEAGSFRFFGVGPVVSTGGAPPRWIVEEAAPPNSQQLKRAAFYALAVDPNNVERVVCGTGGQGLYRREPTSSNKFHWVQKSLPGAVVTPLWVTSVVAAHIAGVTTFYAAPWGGPIFASADGHGWNKVGTGFPDHDVGRIGLAVRPNNPNVVYALVARFSTQFVLGVWRFDKNTNTWREVSGVPSTLFGDPANPDQPKGQGDYDLAIAVDPNDDNRIYLGGSAALHNNQWSGSLYRGDVTRSGPATNPTYDLTHTYIGGSTHADIHALVFAPGEPNKLWVGCDGGVFYSTNPTSSDPSKPVIFKPRNAGLATLTLEHFDHHPTEDSVLFCGSQDNGGLRFTGEEVWFHAFPGDCGHVVVNWDEPKKILCTWTRNVIRGSLTGGNTYEDLPDVPLDSTERKEIDFYAPLVGVPFNRDPSKAADAEIVAFGGVRPWINTRFGNLTNWQSLPPGTSDWRSIPSNTNSDRLNGPIKALAFASASKLYAASYKSQTDPQTREAHVYRFDELGGAWTPKPLHDLGGLLVKKGLIHAIAIDPYDRTGNSIYIAYGGTTGDYRRIWHFDGTGWEHCSGGPAKSDQLMDDVQYNAICVDPDNPSDIYVGSDIGMWRSTNGGSSWHYFSDGLPSAAVLDLKLHQPSRLLRASTHGRGVYEWAFKAGAIPGIELYIRHTQLDQGRRESLDDLDDPTQVNGKVHHTRSPDIKLEAPDASGKYKISEKVDFVSFVDELTGPADEITIHTTTSLSTRIYVQVHNRGVIPANRVRVTCLIADCSGGVPALPQGYEENIRLGKKIATATWNTIGVEMPDDVRVGFPQIGTFDLKSDQPIKLTIGKKYCVLALVHHTDDEYSIKADADVCYKANRKAALRSFTCRAP